MKHSILKKRLCCISIVWIFTLLLGSVTCYATQSMAGNFYGYTSTGNPASDIAAVSYAQNGRSQGSLGYTEHWCADFVSDCARIIGQENAIPFHGGVSGLYTNIINAGGYIVSSPQKGDIVFYNWDHVGIMIDNTNCTSGNMWTYGYSKVETYTYTHINAGSTIRIVRPNYSSKPVNHDPVGYIDSISSTNGHLLITGWAYDPNSPNTPVSLHVYVGGKAGTGASCYTTNIKGTKIKADIYRPDLGANYGYAAEIDVSETGNNNVYIYAINNESGNNPELLLSTGVSRTVFINQDPIGYVDSISSTNGHLLITGWAYDPNSPNTPVSLHVYVGGKAGTGASCYTTNIKGTKMKADIYRPDLGANYGYAAEIDVSETGNNNVYIYAINNEGGNNPELLLSTGVSRTVNIQAVHVHDLSKIASRAATTSTDGNIEYWECNSCGKIFKDSDWKNEISISDTIIPKKQVVTYKISFDANGGTGAPSAQTKTHGKSLTLSSSKPTRTGYTFKNWNTKANGSGNIYESGATYSSDADVTLYAQWNGQTKTITFNANGGTLKGASERKVEYGKQYGELPVPTWNGHKFLGWFTTTSGNTSVSASTVCTSDITLYAHWKEDPDSCEHEYKETGTVAPTCGKDGSRTYTCKHCGNKKTEKIPATGDHKWGEWTVSSEATCVKKGLRKHKCLICGKEETDEIQATGIHEYGSWQTVKEATITEEGSRTRKCINCSATETEAIPVISHEHKWGDWTVEREATCEKLGLSVRTCSGCGNKEEKDIPAIGHKWGDWTLVTPATDEKDGVEVRICENDSTHVESRKTDKREDTVKVTSIKIIANPSTTICAGKKVSLSATVSTKNAVQTVTWKSSNKNYATVTSKGVVTTKKAGIGKTVIITAKSKDGSGKTAKIRIKIVKDGVTKIKLKGKTSRPAGKQLTIKATVTAGKTANTELKWISSNKEYATVNKNGVVTLKEAGKGKYVRITAMATDGTGVKGSIKIIIT